VPFFGRLAASPRGPAELALRTGAAVVVGWGHRLPGNRHRITVVRPALPARTGDFERDVAAIMQVVNGLLEEAVRASPADWVWMHRRWKTRPPAEPA
jgi:KDO2-lipid IV(A) lauroyltransferase